MAELGLPSRGPEGARVRIVVCGSHACGFSRRAEATPPCSKSATKTLFVNGDIVQGERGIDELSAIVEEILELDPTGLG